MKHHESTKDKVAFLQELHRPLEEHWSVKTKFGLDAKGSDYIFKQHLQRLEDIYVNHKQAKENRPSLLNISPVSQLYGVNGLQNDSKEKIEEINRDREARWIDNFQKYNVLTDSQNSTKDAAPDSTRHSRSRSPGIAAMHSRTQSPMHTTSSPAMEQNRSSSAGGTAVREENSTINNTNNSHFRSRCRDASVSRQQLIMLGMYQLTPQQESVYDSFVEMLSTFDSFDMKRIAEDALRDAQRDNLLQAYGGTELAIMRKDIGVNEERERDGSKHLVTLNNSGNAHPESHRQV